MIVGLRDACDSPVVGTVQFLRLAPVGCGHEHEIDGGRGLGKFEQACHEERQTSLECSDRNPIDHIGL